MYVDANVGLCRNEPLPSPKGSDPPSTPQTPKEHSRQPSVSSSPSISTPPSAASTSHSRHSSTAADSPALSSKHSRQASVSLEVGKSSPHSGHHRRHSREHKDKEYKEKDRESRDSGASTPAALASPTSASPAPASPMPLSPRTVPAAAAAVSSEDRPIERSGSSSGGSGSVLRVALLSDETLANLEKDLVPDSARPIKTALLAGLGKLEKGNFAPALEDVEESIKLIGAFP